MSLLVLLPTSSFHLESFLKAQLATGDISKRQLGVAIELNINAALKLKLSTLTPSSEQWVKVLSKLALHDGQSAFELASHYDQNVAEKRLSLFWLNRAIQLQFPPAKLMLAEHYYAEEAYDEVIKETDSVSITALSDSSETIPTKLTDQLLSIRIKSLLALSHIDQISLLAKRIDGVSSYPRSNQIISELKEFDVFGADAKVRTLESNSFTQCSSAIALVATQYEDLQRLKQLKSDFSSHPLSPFMCIADVSYHSLAQLSCELDADKPIQCDESYWERSANKPLTHYIAVMLPNGGANVHLGILYFDRNDPEEVFVHELSHLLGFIDEYELPTGHIACQAPLNSKGINIALFEKSPPYQGKSAKSHVEIRAALRKEVLNKLAWGELIKSSTPILTASGNNWVIGTPAGYENEVGVYRSETCSVEQYNAFKPLAKPTALRHTYATFPEEYIQMLVLNKLRFAMPSYHYNVALSLYRKDEDKAAEHWRKESLNINRNKKHHNTVVHGAPL